MLGGVLEWLGLEDGGRGSHYHRPPTSQDPLSGRTHGRDETEQQGPDAQRSRGDEVSPSIVPMADFVQGSAALSLDDEDDAEMRSAMERAAKGEASAPTKRVAEEGDSKETRVLYVQGKAKGAFTKEDIMREISLATHCRSANGTVLLQPVHRGLVWGKGT